MVSRPFSSGASRRLHPDESFTPRRATVSDKRRNSSLAPPTAGGESHRFDYFQRFCRFRASSSQNLANDLAALGLLLARKTRDRHPSIQDFMLANDSSTVACEIPVYLTAEEIGYYKSKGFFVTLPESKKPITGHIDVLQARNGFIHLLDYKPKAREIDPVNQLVVYALAFASRARLPVKVFKCAWFDERDYFEFFPLQAIKAKTAAGPA